MGRKRKETSEEPKRYASFRCRFRYSRIAASIGAKQKEGERPIPTLRQFRYFVSIVELGSMTRAAEHLNVAQPALGLQMRQLEQELGTSLFERHSRGVAPTEAGKLFHERARQILELVALTTREMAAFRRDPSETLTIGASPSVVQLAGADMLVRAHATMPHVTINLIEETSSVLLDGMRRGEIDILLAHEMPDDPAITRTPWLCEELLFVTAPEGGALRGLQSPADIAGDITLAEALETELVVPSRFDGVRKVIHTTAETRDLKPRVAFQVQSPQALKLLVVDRQVASILPYGLAFQELRTGQLVARRIKDPCLTRTLYLARGEKRLSETHEAALAELLGSIRTRLFDMLGPLAQPCL